MRMSRLNFLMLSSTSLEERLDDWLSILLNEWATWTALSPLAMVGVKLLANPTRETRTMCELGLEL